jgi:hypothetical protein
MADLDSTESDQPPQTPAVFTLFSDPRFPAEMRLKIWEFVCYTDPLILKLRISHHKL